MTAAKANKSLGTIQRNLWNCPKNVKEIVYTSLVRYASAAWDPFLKKDISALERVQRKAALFCSQNYDRYASVTDMIKELGWATLETRRRQSRLTLMYKLTLRVARREAINLNFACHIQIQRLEQPCISAI